MAQKRNISRSVDRPKRINSEAIPSKHLQSKSAVKRYFKALKKCEEEETCSGKKTECREERKNFQKSLFRKFEKQIEPRKKVSAA